MFKTGTTSLATAMRGLGYSTNGAYWALFPELAPLFDLSTQAFRVHYGVIQRQATQSQAFADSPWLYLYRELDAWFPGSRFILTLRDAREVARSDLSMWHRSGNLVERWESETGESPALHMFEERYLAHVANVRSYFDGRPEFLELDLTQEANPWLPLCDFLGVKAPSVRFPHANIGNYDGSPYPRNPGRAE